MGSHQKFKFIYVLPNLSIKDQQRIDDGNATMLQTCSIIRACIRNDVPCILENPSTSMMWAAPPLQKLMKNRFCSQTLCDMCQFGARWRKRTKLVGWHIESFHRLSHLCAGKKSICSRTHKPHIILQGYQKGSNILWTALAQVYPCQFGSALADTLIESFLHIRACTANQVLSGSTRI